MNDAATTAAERYRLLLQRLEANEREFRRLGRAVVKVQEDERRRLARELHDGVGQNLTVLKHRLAQLGAALGAADAALRAPLEDAIQLCTQALEDTRQMSRLLRPPILDDLGLEAALGWLGRSQSAAGATPVSVEIGPLPTLDEALQTLLFRSAQEALTNALKHAAAQSVLLRLVARDGWAHLQVLDDGRGCDPQQALVAGGSGLSGLRERLRLSGGSLRLQSSPGEGCCVQIRVPLEAD
ncbi:MULTISPECIES: sensor histidine kinase [Xanthomonas]|uniref:Signal transduction histidine-protein kinase/phosphatase DegS n=2 Tax=Xanthomonas sacchari TaxID=56458 RepID=A0ABT3DUC5_9XANT|nr:MULTISPECIES: sensor histidine kinase [Xanthomonas]AJC45073.1 histidine kinase [Xanthomonas sacchari]KAB7780613.1 two-component sensor histidine kinase [Xanthomonas sp. LMG 12460]MCW0377408.1 Signal transduction histidine-protein kinase/phosphatase DegS [Xanthomonas sacchari]MCW0395083.1 Signal transduction histidine-protein kinase/phosphatase DegS [Xanthomonas sacchari]MCW0398599.1 Signal transduction histidine-protein kinase/phosphatase DegS [Xanthomonas sacchari]